MGTELTSEMHAYKTHNKMDYVQNTADSHSISTHATKLYGG
jgi:hypothetical protein